MKAEVGDLIRILVDRPNGAQLYTGDIAKVVRSLDGHLACVLVEGRGTSTSEWLMHHDKYELVTAEPRNPETVDVFALATSLI